MAGSHALPARPPEEPCDYDDRGKAGGGDDDLCDGHGWSSFGCQWRRRLALETTVRELNAIAAAAISGESKSPVSG